jgi:hypothetical protein
MRQYTHEVVDSRTGAVVGQYVSAGAALRVADRRDAEFGAVRYTVRPIAVAARVASDPQASLLEASERMLQSPESPEAWMQLHRAVNRISPRY